jgi:hypothetical protein
LTLIHRNKKPDELFLKYVAYSSSSKKLFIAVEFKMLFTELRAFYVSGKHAEYFQEDHNKSTVRDVDIYNVVYALLSALSYLEDFENPSSVVYFMKDLGLGDKPNYTDIPEDQHFNVAYKLLDLTIGVENWSAQMRRTINKANALE